MTRNKYDELQQPETTLRDLPRPERMKPLFRKDRPWSTKLLIGFTWAMVLAVLVFAAAVASLVMYG